MGVLIEAVNVVIRNATVEARLAGGMQEYERRCPNGSLRRFEEAEHAARKAFDLAPDRADVLGNLAAVLLEQGRLDEARQIAEKTLAAAPTDPKNKAVLAAVNKTASRRGPWCRRLLRTPHNELDER